MKRKLIIPVGMLALSLLALGSCQTGHEHSYGTSWDKDGTHHWHTCTVEGCSEVSGKAEHTGGTATETEKAICEVCGESYGSLKGHEHAYTVSKVDAAYLASAADCDSAAVYYKSCECGEKGTETFEDGEALGHTWGEWETKTPATCEDKEVEHRECSVEGCDAEETRDGDAALGHKMTTKYDGTHHWTSCDNEGCEKATEKVAHSGGTATETEKAICEGCGQPYGELHVHVYDQEKAHDDYLVSAADCDSAAVYNKSCACGAEGTETFEVGEPLGHTLSNEWTKDETHHWHKCTVDGCEGTDVKSIHTWDEGTVTTEPTEEEEGVRTYACTVCGETKEEPIAKLTHIHVPSSEWTTDGTQHWKTCSGCSEKVELANHQEVVIQGEPATCLAPGLTDGKKCEICEKITLEQEEIEQLSHSYTGEYVDNGDGTHSQKCVNGCTGKSEGVAHTYVEGTHVAPTNTQEGKLHYECDICGKSSFDVTLPALTKDNYVRELCSETDYSKIYYMCTLSDASIETMLEDVAYGKEIVKAKLEELAIKAETTVFYEDYLVVAYTDSDLELANCTYLDEDGNKKKFIIEVLGNETLRFYYNGSLHTFPEGEYSYFSGTELVAEAKGTYTIYWGNDNGGYGNFVAPKYEKYSIYVNDVEKEGCSVTPSEGNYAQFEVELKANDVLTVKGDNVVLVFPALDKASSYTASANGKYPIYINTKNDVYVGEAIVEYAIKVNGTVKTGCEVENSDPTMNKAQYVVTLAKGDVLVVAKGETALVFPGEGDATSYTAERDGDYTIYLNNEEKVYLGKPAAEVASSYSIKVNGAAKDGCSVTPDSPTDHAQFVVELKKNDVLVVYADTTALEIPLEDNATSYTAERDGEYTIWVNAEDKVYLGKPADPEAQDTVLYLTPNANWKQSNARFAAYFFGNGETWVSMTDENGDGVYEVVAPAGYPNVIFCRMNPSAAANNWNNKWNQTADLKVPTDGNVHYTVKAGTWDKGGGTWSAFEA